MILSDSRQSSHMRQVFAWSNCLVILAGSSVVWLAGVACAMFCLFGAGKLIFGETTMGLLLLGGAVALGVLICWHLSDMKGDDWPGK
jgi:hypothetical protein